MADETRKIIVVGAGLGGLTLTLSLLRAGFKVVLLEQAPRLGEVGAGIQISANGARVLHRLGLADALGEVAFRPKRGEIRHWQTGETLIIRPLGDTSVERFGFPYYHLHRADIHSVLEAAVRAADRGAVRLDAKVDHIEQDGAGVSAMTASGEVYVGDVLIGCDGIHSTIRRSLFGSDAPRFTGCIAWRATIPIECLPKDHVRPVASNWIGRGGHFVHYYLRRGALVNCVGVQEGREWSAESWSKEGDRQDFLADFEDWHEDLKILIRAAGRCFCWGLFDRDPLPRWGQGRVTLLGDACHPMLPFMAQGAVMGLEDAHTLARCLQENVDAEEALSRYEELRRERTAVVQRMARDNMSFFHDPDVENLEERLNNHRDAHMWLYGFDVTDQKFAA
ncbi:MAG: FAD-dependent monooxygenase [Pseudomonadota bacterium]|nr:FAD-dependent monooxygenase [Pseudomonadota bacterium]